MAECSRCHRIVEHECPVCTPEIWAAIEAKRNPPPSVAAPPPVEPVAESSKRARRVTTRHGDTSE